MTLNEQITIGCIIGVAVIIALRIIIRKLLP